MSWKKWIFFLKIIRINIFIYILNILISANDNLWWTIQKSIFSIQYNSDIYDILKKKWQLIYDRLWGEKMLQLSMRVIKMYELILDHTLGCSRVKTQNFLMMCLMKRDNEFRLGGDMVRNSSYLPFLLHLVIYDFFWPCSAPWLVMWLVWAPIFIPLISFISFCWGVVIRRQNKSEKIFKKTDLNFF